VAKGGRSRSEFDAAMPAVAPRGADVDRSLNARVVIENIRPRVDDGAFPIKRTVGEGVDVHADVFADGHDVLTVILLDRHLPPRTASARTTRGAWRETPMAIVAEGTDEWSARFRVDEIGWHEYAVEGWIDRFKTWRRDVQIKIGAGRDVDVELVEGSQLVREAAARASVADDAMRLLEAADRLSDRSTTSARLTAALDQDVWRIMDRYADRRRATQSPPLRVWVDRARARFGAWYEMFPRSAGPDPSRSATFLEAAGELPRIAALGFDVVYLPPIHPIGRSFRKGPNNTPFAGPDDPGSPWAIGSDEGGHTAIEPGLGTFDDFAAFRQEAERLGLEVALDLAWQCSPDHPWVREHPEWFKHRPDGTIKYAENPPKQYQDIYPFDFESEDWSSLWQALLEVTEFWIARGVRIFRVDNPHTKPLGFWQWLIDRVHADHPAVVFLSEAFTRPKVMRRLAKVGFSQSYSYFTWRNSKAEITDYFTELTGSDVREYFRPNLFANTPDILHAYLQHGGRPAFEARLLLAATLGASYGIYSGFEVCESRAVRPGSEEYADSEKYQRRRWDWSRAGHINELIARVNRIRHEHAALQFDWPLQFLATDNPEVIAYSKIAPDDSERLVIVINLDPHHTQQGFVDSGVDAEAYVARDLIDDVEYTWHRGWNYVRFDPGIRQGHILKIESRR
jgi:starch synthase (maltosyl-transferring)